MNPLNPDTDGDQMPDGWEFTYLSVMNPISDDSSGDADGDGVTNRQEYWNNSDPSDSSDPSLVLFFDGAICDSANKFTTGIDFHWVDSLSATTYELYRTKNDYSKYVTGSKYYQDSGAACFGVNNGPDECYDDWRIDVGPAGPPAPYQPRDNWFYVKTNDGRKSNVIGVNSNSCSVVITDYPPPLLP